MNVLRNTISQKSGELLEIQFFSIPYRIPGGAKMSSGATGNFKDGAWIKRARLYHAWISV